MKPSLAHVVAVSVALALSAAACGAKNETPVSPTPPAGRQTMTFSGTASIGMTGVCSGGSGHAISAGEGTITIALTQASAPRVAVQVCHPTAQNHAVECTVPPFASLASGASITATLRGGRSQTVTVVPDGCGSSSSVAATSVNYTIAVSFPG